MQILREIHEQLLQELEDVYPRDHIAIQRDRLITGLVGSRGVGKTTFILDYIKKQYGQGNRKVLYISADNIYFSENNLFDLAQKFIREDAGELLCIDEIHRYVNWAQELKNIYDSFPKLRLVFSGSSSINIIQQKYDLSRRVIMEYFPGLSFREWLEFMGYAEYRKLPILSLKNLLEGEFTLPEEISQIPGIIGLFHQYLKSGYYPTRRALSNDDQFYITLMGSVDKTIYSDIASYYSLRTSSLDLFKKILYFIATTPPSKINAYSISQSLKKHHQDIAQYIDMMRNSSLLRYLLIDKHGHAMLRNAEKVYLDNSNLSYAIADNIGRDVEVGCIRELFILNQLENAKYKVFYSKKGDLIVNENVLEIGGANKTGGQIQEVERGYLVKDDILSKSGNTIPLYLFGFLY